MFSRASTRQELHDHVELRLGPLQFRFVGDRGKRTKSKGHFIVVREAHGPDFRVRTALRLIPITDLNHMTSVLDDVLSVQVQDTLAPLGI
jgi:hypothetical protein